MKYVHINPSPNRAHRRMVNAIARREPTQENLKLNDVISRLPVNTPYVNPARVLRPKGKSARRIYRAAVRQQREAA